VSSRYFYCEAYCFVCDTATYWRGYSTPGKVLDLADRQALLSRKISHRTHPLVYECKQMFSDLLEDGVEVEINVDPVSREA
jgi:hypothetical protein